MSAARHSSRADGSRHHNAESITEAATRLRGEGTALRQRSAAPVLDAVCRVLDEWRDPDSEIAPRAELETALTDPVGFSPSCVREGLTRGLADWSGQALRDVVARELDAQSTPSRSVASGFELTGLLLAGCIPMPTLLAMLLPLVLRSPVLVKTSSRDRTTARLVASSIARVDAQLGRCIEVVDFPGDDDACSTAFLAADCVVAMGSDETLERVSQRVRSPQRLVAYGHRLSIAVVGPLADDDAERAAIADRIALDTALWDQQGCLSAAAVYVVGSLAHARATAAAIAAALARAEHRWPRGRVEPDSAAMIRSERAEAEMRRAAEARDSRVELHASRDTSWTVVLEPDTQWRPTPLHRFLRVYPVEQTALTQAVTSVEQSPEIASLESALRPIARHLAAVALEGFGGDTRAACEMLAMLGASRVCRAGQLQAPPLAWHHDGQPLLLPLARVGDLEV